MNGRAFFQVPFPLSFIKALIELKFRAWLDTSNMHVSRFILKEMTFFSFQAAEGNILTPQDLLRPRDSVQKWQSSDTVVCCL